jgi:hypothetical protein
MGVYEAKGKWEDTCLVVCAANDEKLKASFSAAAKDDALVVNLGGWEWKADRAYPSWSALMNAKVYTDATYEALRKQVLAQHFKALPVSGSSMDVTTLRVEGHGVEEVSNVLRMYCPARCRQVPGNVAMLQIRMSIHQARALQALPDHLVSALATGAMTVVWGLPHEVEQVTGRLPGVGMPIKQVDVFYFIKTKTRVSGASAGDHPCVKLLIRIMGHSEFLKIQVYSCSCCSCRVILYDVL